MTRRPLRDTRLKFNSKKHEYRIGKKRLRSVTEWVKSFFAPFDEKMMSKIVAMNRKRAGEKITPAQVRKEWKLTALEGSAIHKDIEEYILGKKDILDIERLKSVSGANAYESLKNTYKSVAPFPEVRIYSESLGLAGTIDLLLLLEDGSVTLVDWKTNRKLYTSGKNAEHAAVSELDDVNMTHYQLQLNTYAVILEQEYGFRVNKLLIYHLSEQGATEIVVPDMREVVRRMLE